MIACVSKLPLETLAVESLLCQYLCFSVRLVLEQDGRQTMVSLFIVDGGNLINNKMSFSKGRSASRDQVGKCHMKKC